MPSQSRPALQKWTQKGRFGRPGLPLNPFLRGATRRSPLQCQVDRRGPGFSCARAPCSLKVVSVGGQTRVSQRPTRLKREIYLLRIKIDGEDSEGGSGRRSVRRHSPKARSGEVGESAVVGDCDGWNGWWGLEKGRLRGGHGACETWWGS
jgi:hypothetical protein